MIGNLMIISVTSVEWTWLGLERLHACLVCCCELSVDELVDVALGTNYVERL